MRRLPLPFRASGVAGRSLGPCPHPAIRSFDLINIRSSLPPSWRVLSCRSVFTVASGASEWQRPRVPPHLGGEPCKSLSRGLYSCTGTKSSSSGTPYAARTLLASELYDTFDMRNSFHRHLSTTTTAIRRVWLARLPEIPTFWRNLLGLGHRDRVEPLVEVLLPGNSRGESLAVGGTEMLALSEGKLFGAPLSLPGPERSSSAKLILREITPEPVELSGVSMNDFIRHCRRSEDLGICLAVGVELTPRPHMQAGTDTHPRFVKVAAGKQHFAALTSHGVLYTWGKGGSWGAGSPLGHGDSKQRCRPTPVVQFINSGEFVVDVACGTASTCVVTSTGRVFSSGAADFGINGSGMLVSSQVFRELEFFHGILSPSPLDAKRRIEEEQLQQLETLRKNMEEMGVDRSHFPLRPFEVAQDASEKMNCSEATAGLQPPRFSMNDPLQLPKVMCGTYHCGLLTPEGALWLWGRNNCLQLSRDKAVMASGGESNYPLLAEFFARADLPLESCALGACHSLAVARNGAVYEWGGPNSKSPHTVDLHWQYPESIFKSRVTKAVAGGYSSSTGFSAVLTEKGEAFLWGPGVLKMPLGLEATAGQTPELLRFPLDNEESRDKQNNGKWRVVDIFAGQQGCVFVTTDCPQPLPFHDS